MAYTYTHNIYYPNQLVDQPVQMLISVEPELMLAIQDEAARRNLFAEELVLTLLRERFAAAIAEAREREARGD